MSNKSNDILMEQLFEDGKEMGIKLGLTGEVLHNLATTYAKTSFENLDLDQKGNTMILYRKSLLTGEAHSMDLNVTREQLSRWEGGELLQNVFPHWTVEERDFIKFGCTQEEWNEVMR